MPKPNANKHRDFSAFDKMSTEALEHILWADSQLSNGEESDVDAILYIMEVIEKREGENPTGKFIDVDTAWASFTKNYLPYAMDEKSLYEFEEENTGIKHNAKVHPSRSTPRRRSMRIACVTAAIMALLLAGSVTASALGFDLWGAVARWTKDTFGFSSIETDTQETPEQNSSAQYEKLQDTLDDYNVTAQIVPTWFPGEYSIKDIEVNETPAQTVIHAKYDSDNGEFSINITVLEKPSTRTYEKDNENVTAYLANEIEHYIMTNLGLTKIVWQTENFECTISGSFTLDEAKKIVDSIYERK